MLLFFFFLIIIHYEEKRNNNNGNEKKIEIIIYKIKFVAPSRASARARATDKKNSPAVRVSGKIIINKRFTPIRVKGRPTLQRTMWVPEPVPRRARERADLFVFSTANH